MFYRLFYFSLTRPEELFHYKDQQEYQKSGFGVKTQLPPHSPGRVVADHMSRRFILEFPFSVKGAPHTVAYCEDSTVIYLLLCVCPYLKTVGSPWDVREHAFLAY